MNFFRLSSLQDVEQRALPDTARRQSLSPQKQRRTLHLHHKGHARSGDTLRKAQTKLLFDDPHCCHPMLDQLSPYPTSKVHKIMPNNFSYYESIIGSYFFAFVLALSGMPLMPRRLWPTVLSSINRLRADGPRVRIWQFLRGHPMTFHQLVAVVRTLWTTERRHCRWHS